MKKQEILNSLSDLVNNFLEKILMYGHNLCRAITFKGSWMYNAPLHDFWQIN